MSLQILTANDLRTGEVVYFTSTNEWSSYISDAQIARDELAADRLATRGEYAEQQQLVVGAYLIEIDDDESFPNPLRYREQLRVNGPSIHSAYKKPTRSVHKG